MEKFADCIPEFPRRSPGIFTLHKKLSSMKTKLDSYTELMRRLPSKAESWEGAAREAFHRALRRELKQTQRLDKGLDNGAKAILKYAYMAEATERNIDAARARMQALDRQVDAVPDSEQNDKFEELKPEAQATAKSAKETIDLLNKAGDVCAAELRAALHLEAVEPNDEGKNAGELHELNHDDINRINHELKHMDFRTVSQGGIGDCYLLATLMAMMRTPEGRKRLQNSIRPHFRNGRQDGYMVTLYEDPDHPERARTVFVDRTYLRGANGGNPGVVSVLEAAYGQMYEGGTRGNSVFGPTGISGGQPSAVMEEVTGKASTVYQRDFHRDPFYNGYSDDRRKDIHDALKDHRPVVASSNTQLFFKKDYLVKEVTIHGEKHRVQIAKNHAYVVVAADKDGVTVRNPWGESPDLDGNPDPKFAEFKMSWKDFGDSFHNVHVGGGYPK